MAAPWQRRDRPLFRKPIDERSYLALLEHRHAQEMIDLINANREHLRQWLPWVDATTSVGTAGCG